MASNTSLSTDVRRDMDDLLHAMLNQIVNDMAVVALESGGVMSGYRSGAYQALDQRLEVLAYGMRKAELRIAAARWEIAKRRAGGGALMLDGKGEVKVPSVKATRDTVLDKRLEEVRKRVVVIPQLALSESAGRTPAGPAR